MDVFDLFAKVTLDTGDYKKGVDGVKNSSEQMEAQMHSLQSMADAMAGRVKVLSARFDEEKTKLSELSAKLNESIAVNGETSEETQKLADQFAKAQAKVKSLGAQLTTAAAESARVDEQLEALKNGTAEVEDGMDDAGKSTEKFSDKLKAAESGIASFAEKLQSGLATAAKIGGAALTAASAAVGFLTKTSIEQYSEYEQLVGGVETLFKTSSDVVLGYANKAYETAGLSANDYMSTVTGFSASLLQSLDGDTAKAAEKANLAITDMSDNANKMGTDMASIQNAYQGFAKQNYTMLDNLKLGYGGTKEEMQRLLKDAEALSGVKYDLSSYSDIVDAIHVVQTEMGITGTTALEASTTIEGSVNSAKAAWQNLMTGIADENADIAGLVGSFADSLLIAGENIIPRVMQILEGVGDAILELSPVISEAVPQLVEGILPELISTGATLLSAVVNGVVAAIPSLYNALMGGVETILTDVFGVTEENATAFSEGVTGVILAIGDGFSALVTSAQTEGTFLNEVWTGLQEAGQALGDFFSALFDTISTAFQWCVEQINTEGTLLNTYVTKTWDSIKTVVQAAIDVVTDIIEVFTSVLEGDWSGAWASVESIAKTTWDAINTIVTNVVDTINGFLATMVDTAKDLVGQFIDAMAQKFAEIYSEASGWVQDYIIAPITKKGQDLYDAGKNLIDKMWQGLKDAWSKVTEWWDGLTFSNKTAHATVETSGSHKNGLNYVPYDGYVAELHRGESVLTAEEASLWRAGLTNDRSGGGNFYLTQNIDVVPQTPAEFAAATEAYFQQARWVMAF